MELKKLTILHSNDMHGDFLSEDIDDKLVGGVSLLSGYISKVRKEEENVLYCVAGDMFRGSIIDSEYQGFSTIEIMNMLSPDIVTIGNHETDYGIGQLLFLEKCAKFPIVNANLHIKTNNSGLFKPCKIIKIDGMRILFIGILTEEVINQTKGDGLIGSLIDIKDAAREVERICNNFNNVDIDFTVLLTHIGFEEDKKLAAMLDPSLGVDVIIGGHSHTIPEEPAIVNDIVIVQAGTGTNQIGRFDINVDTDNNCIHDFKWKIVPIDDSHCPYDKHIETILEHFKEQTDNKYQRVVTRLRRELTHPKREQETELGNLLADILLDSLAIDIVLFGSGAIRTEKMGPIILYQDIMECLPYDDPLYCLDISGREFKEMIRYMLRDGVWQGEHCEFYQFSRGLKVEYDRATHEFNKFNFNGKPIDEDAVYKVALAKFHFNSFEEFFNIPLAPIVERARPKIVSTSINDIVEQYLSDHQHLNASIEGRLVVL